LGGEEVAGGLASGTAAMDEGIGEAIAHEAIASVETAGDFAGKEEAWEGCLTVDTDTEAAELVVKEGADEDWRAVRVVFAQEGHSGGEVGVQEGVGEIFQTEAKALFAGGRGAGASVSLGIKKAFAECEAVRFFVGVAEHVAVTVNDSDGKIEDALWKRLTWLNVGIYDNAEGLVLE
jgi:hypothetical protein